MPATNTAKKLTRDHAAIGQRVVAGVQRMGRIMSKRETFMSAKLRTPGAWRNPELHVERMRTAQGLIIRLSTGLAIGRIYRYGSDLPWTVRYGGVDERTANSLSDALDMFEDLCRGGTPWPHLD